MYRVVWNAYAKIDLEEIFHQLTEYAPQAAHLFPMELQDLGHQLATFPRSYQLTADSDIRRVILRSCRFALYFRVVEESVEILAILPQMANTQPQVIGGRYNS